MPSTVNGIGTWYYGKRNLYTHEGVCQACNRFVKLSSYDTREWVVVVFIPIIPLRQKHIMNSCPVCRRHYEMPLKKYLNQKDEEYDAAYQKVNAAPNDPEAAIELLGVMAAYQDIHGFQEAAGQIEHAFANNAKVQGAIGSVYYQCGQMEKAQTYFECSLALQEDEDIHEILGFVHLRMSNPDAAAGHFQFILDKQDAERVGVLMALVEGYQATGRHQEALELLTKMAELAPEAADDKEFKKSVKLSQKHLASGKAIKSKAFVPGKSLNDSTGSTGKTWAIAASIAALAFLVYVATAFYRGSHAKVFLVNGLERSYEVTLNDKPYTMPQYGYMKVSVSEGDVTMSADQLGIEPQQFKLSTSFWGRPFSKRFYVINPDQVAPVMWMKVFYAENPNNAPETQWKLHMGKAFYSFDGVEFPFKELPDEISLSSGSKMEPREQVTMLAESEVAREDLPDVIEEHLGAEMLVSYLQKNLYYEPENDAYLERLSEVVEPERFIELLRPGLDAVPVRIQWHRYYQILMDQTSPETDLIAEYAQRIERLPNDPALQYLMGRIIDDDNEASLAWLNKSISGPNPCSYGYNAIAYSLAANGEFESALAMSEKAVQLEPLNDNFAAFYYDMLLACGQTEKALAYCRDKRNNGADYFTWVSREMLILAEQGKDEQARNVFVQWYMRNKQIVDKEVADMLQTMNDRDCAYAKGDFEKYLQVVGEPNELNDRIVLTLNYGNSAPEEFVENPDIFNVNGALAFYISETRLGHPEQARVFLESGITQLQTQGYANRLVAACLESGKVENPDVICKLTLDPAYKAVLLTALGVRCPEHQKQFFELAEKLNYRREFPHHFLKSVHAEPAKGGKTVNSAG